MRTYPVVDALIDMLGAWLAHAREVAEVCKLDRAEYEHIAHDLGIGADDLDALVRNGSAADELPRLLKAIGLDAMALERAQPQTVRGMETVCAMCRHKRRCVSDLAAGAAAQRHGAYCGNAPTLAALSRGVH